MRSLAVAAAVASAFALACGGASPEAAEPKQRVDLSHYLPAQFESEPIKGHEKDDPRIAHVRVWTDAAVRVAPKWKDDLTDQIDAANQLLQPLLGVRLQIDAWKDWDRTGDVHGALAQLQAVDAGSDAAWVIGYTGPLDVATKAMSELGDARLLGRHVVVHAWADKPETDLIAMSLPSEMTDGERQEVVGAHRRHKQAAVLLHHLAITLGAVSTTEPSWLDNPLYSAKQTTFPDRTRELLAMSLAERLGGSTDQVIAPKLVEQLDKEWGGWVAADRDQVVAQLRAIVDAARSGKTAGDVPAEAASQYDRIRELRKRDAHQALVELDNLLAAYPGNATLHQLKCDIMIDKPGIASKETRAACARVSELAPGDPTPHFAVAEALAAANDIRGARAELVAAEAKIGNLDHGVVEAWKRLADDYYTKLHAPTWAEDALAKGKLDNDPQAIAIHTERVRYGVPRGLKGVAPEDEGALLVAVHKALELTYGNKHGEARKVLDAADKKWPNTPGVLGVRCDLALRDGDIGDARELCARAVQLQPTESWALYLSGVIALKDTSAGAAQVGIAQLKKAIEADPELGQAWRALAQAYARVHDTAALDKLRADYAAKFNQNLP
jgi:predicted Zn-dependent protease|nr:hypothetical protein [Kofleriaceae bacterium]